jgi:hypothetical protein
VLDGAWFGTEAASMVATMEAGRATWQSWHVRAEAQRRARSANVPTGQVTATVDRLVAVALADHSVALTVPGDGVSEPAVLRRVDGRSVYTIAGADVFTSRRILAAEQRLVAAAGRTDGMVADAATVDVALLEMTANGVELNAGQVGLVRALAGSGARVQVAIAPAGSGKTTAMRALSRAWAEAGGTVVGLAPSAAAAALGNQIDTHTDTLAKLTWSITHQDLPGWAAAIGAKTLLVIDEAGTADTLSLDAAVGFVLERGGSVRLVGDDQQLAAIGAGGVLRDIATRYGAARLNELVRFADPAEGGASLALRDGRVEALGFYLDRGRVHVGDLATITNQVFDAWQADRAQGLDAIMLAPTRELVADLNQRARSHRLQGAIPPHEVALADGLTASVGDVIITRTNDRRLRTSNTDWVKNGDRWTITSITATGALRALHTRSRRTVVLPADYVASSVELGYASTVHTAQGVSTDTMHGLATGTEGRQQLYTMLTRGRHANHVYLQVVGDGDPHTLIRPDTLRPPTATDILEAILARDTAPASATSLQHQLDDPRVRLGQAVARYTDALTVAAETLAGDLALRALERRVDQILPGVPWCEAWPALRAHLLLIGADGHDPITELALVAAGTELGTATDPAAVLDWRLDTTGTRSHTPGPLPWIPNIPHTLATDPEWGPYLTARGQLVADLADTVHQNALTAGSRPSWVTTGVGEPAGQAIADITVWRAAMNVPDGDLRPTGERQLPHAAARWQRHLEHRLAGDRYPALSEWGPLLHQLAPAVGGDDFTPVLAQRLAALSSAGINARSLLQAAVAESDLPDDHAAAAIWWRIARHLTPDIATAVQGDQPLTPAWTTTRADTIGADRTSELQSSRLAETVNSQRPDGVHHQRKGISKRAHDTARGIDR